MSGETEVEVGLSEFEALVIDFFCDGVRLLGLPKSIGEIYGLLYVTQEALSLDDLVSQLGISKGSASQGLKMLRELGAVKESNAIAGRRSYYEPDVELKQLVGGFIKEQVRPHLASGEGKLADLKEMVAEMPGDARADFYAERLERLGRWSKRAKVVLPLLQKFLGR
ncbi:MAG: DNA-binding transcriptional regulator GbsR (MarR family) [Akkermansiaceae bacterium]|jgi:DNA-binding transcriptional regulator GbsR (MarR family)